MIGLALTGIFADKYGQRWTIIGALALVVSIVVLEVIDNVANCGPVMLYLYHLLFS
jgi:hypothetical protein